MHIFDFRATCEGRLSTHGGRLTGVVLRFASGWFAPFRAQFEPSAQSRGADQMRRSPAPARHRKSRPLPLRFYTQELPCHRVDLGEICRDLLIAAALTGDRMEAAVRERLGRACAANVDCRGKLPLLLRAGRRLSRARENRRDFLVQKYCRKLDCTARWDRESSRINEQPSSRTI